MHKIRLNLQCRARAKKGGCAPLPPPQCCRCNNVACGEREALTGVRQNINLADLGIASLKPKRAATRGFLFPGAESAARADKLAEMLSANLADTDIKVKAGQMGGITHSEPGRVGIRPGKALVQTEECSERDVRVSEIRRAPSSLGSVWAKCPAQAAKKITQSGRLLVRWVSARVEILQLCPMQCFKCLQTGHTKRRCTASADRSDKCYRCDQAGTRASTKPKCPLCTDLGRPANHRLMAKTCSPPKEGSKAKKGEITAAAKPKGPIYPSLLKKESKASKKKRKKEEKKADTSALPPPRNKKGSRKEAMETD